MNFKYMLPAVACLAGLWAWPSFAGVIVSGITINGTTITFNDSSTQSTAALTGVVPADHGGTGNTVGGTDSFIGGGYGNLVTDDYGTIGGGQGNQAGDNTGTTTDRSFATVGGGQDNTASGIGSTVGGGWNNRASGAYATIGGGGGFSGNTASGTYATIGGGYKNTASGPRSTIHGGASNAADGYHSTVVGGAYNTASGYAATVVGGRNNIADGAYSFAAGRSAIDGGNDNSFVWGGAAGTRTSAGADTFNVWSAGGIYVSGLLHAASDRNMKEAFTVVNAREVLDKVVEMPVTSWRFKSEDDSVRHIGPVAQDFMAAFGYGVDDKHITATDADGVALAAIQGLHQMLQEKDVTLLERKAALHEQAQSIDALHSENALLQARLARLEKAILMEQD